MKKELNALLAIIYELSGDRTWKQMAAASGLSVSTVYKLFTGYTRFPRFLTIQKLARSVGLTITFDDTRILIKNV